MTVHRARTQVWVLLAAFLSVLAASTAMTTIAAFASATREQSVVRMLRSASPDQLGIELTAGPSNVDPVTAPTELAHDVRKYLPQLSARSEALFTGQDAFSLLGASPPAGDGGLGDDPGAIPAGSTELSFWSSPTISAHVRLVEGRLPTVSAGSRIEVALSQSDAAARHLRVGSSYPFSSVGAQGEFVVVGVYRLDASSDPYSALLRSNLGTGLPMLVDTGDFNGATLGLGGCAYLVRPDFSTLTGANLDAVSSAVDTFTGALVADQKLGASATVQTGLTALLGGTVKALAVARTAIALPCVLLLAVAACTLAFTARLLAIDRRRSTALMLARGARPAQLAGCGAAEALVLCALAQVPAVLLAGPLASTVSSAGAVPGFGPSVWAAAAAAWLAGTITLAGYAAQLPVDAERTRGNVVVGLGAEIALVALGALALWELAAHGPAEAAQGLVDPVVVLAPALAVLACAVLSLRVIPLAGKAMQLLAARARSWAAPYGAWSAARAGRATAGPVVLLVMAIGTVVLAGSYLSASQRSALDQADYSVGTDVRVSGVNAQALTVAGDPATLPGVAGAAEVIRLTASIGADGSEGSTQILVADPAELAAAGQLRTDLGPGGVHGLTQPLTAAAAAGRIAPEHGLVLPGRPQTVALELGLTGSAARGGGRLELTFAAGTGEPEPLDVPVPAGSTARVQVSLSRIVGSGAEVAWPLRLTRLNLLIPASSAGQGAADSSSADAGMTVRSVTADGVTAALPASQVWSMATEQEQGTTIVSAMAVPRNPTVAIGAVATSGFLSAAGKHVGDTVVILVGAAKIPVHIYGEAGAIPTIAPAADGLLLDRADVDAYEQSTGTGPVGTLEWWLAAQPGRIDAVAAEAAAVPGLGGAVQNRLAVRADYVADPVRGGPVGALRISAVAVALLALIGFATRLANEVRSRAREIAIARALGLDPGRVALAFGVQQAFEVAVAVIGGCLVGSVLADRIVPVAIVARDGSAAVPTPVAVPPWPEAIGSAGLALLCVLAAACWVGVVAARLSISVLLRSESEAGR
ncbi:FtsX-like permease family protein [Actinospica robiniae]|nr:FtsX-like permease family protein [Actinospica robiniae]